MRKQQLGSDDPRTLKAMDSLASILLEAKQPDKALPLFRECLDRQRKQLGANSPQLANRLGNIGAALLRHKQYSEAEKHLRECLVIRTKNEPDDWRTSNTRCRLGAALLGRQKYAAAEPLLVQGYEGLKEGAAKIPPEEQRHLTTSLERLVELYVAWGKPGEAAKWRKELAAQMKAAEKHVKPKEK
jgi:tetratricopeptide (TPR) repeat protein